LDFAPLMRADLDFFREDMRFLSRY